MTLGTILFPALLLLLFVNIDVPNLYLHIYNINFYRIETPKEQFDALFKNLDTNDDGKLGFEEFLMGMRWLQKVIQSLYHLIKGNSS